MAKRSESINSSNTAKTAHILTGELGKLREGDLAWLMTKLDVDKQDKLDDYLSELLELKVRLYWVCL